MRTILKLEVDSDVNVEITSDLAMEWNDLPKNVKNRVEKKIDKDTVKGDLDGWIDLTFDFNNESYKTTFFWRMIEDIMITTDNGKIMVTTDDEEITFGDYFVNVDENRFICKLIEDDGDYEDYKLPNGIEVVPFKKSDFVRWNNTQFKRCLITN